MVEMTESEQGYSSTIAYKVAGITYRQLDNWARINVMTPSIAPATGSGSRRQYSYQDLLKLRAIKRLQDAGLKLAKIKTIIQHLSDRFGTDLASSNLVMDGTTPILVTGDELVDVLKNGQGVLNVLPMAPIQDEVDAAIVVLYPSANADDDTDAVITDNTDADADSETTFGQFELGGFEAAVGE